MKLLQLTAEGHYKLTKELSDLDIPRYAILSHTWGSDEEEVTLQDIAQGTGRAKEGIRKIDFCVQQAKRDGISFVWIDSCCIDQSNTAQLSEAINSMFRWYSKAVKCYVYLSDVSYTSVEGKKQGQDDWQPSFRSSRWFKRGWTLQELLAPEMVEFFSREGDLLGNKRSLEAQICEITSIPTAALRGRPLREFSITERVAWQANRSTKREEDIAYSLLGICDISLPVLYGEGKAHAFWRLRSEFKAKWNHTFEINGTRNFQDNTDYSITFGLPDAIDISPFVAREKELDTIRQKLQSDGSRRVVVLHGLGGIGKTQLALAFAKRHRDEFSAIFWLRAQDEQLLQKSFKRIQRRIRHDSLAARRCGDEKDAIEFVKYWLDLTMNTRWLLIFDGYDDPGADERHGPGRFAIQKYFPESYQGAILITTRCSTVTIGHRLEIQKITKVEDSLKILSNACERRYLSKNLDIEELISRLDGLPLALATAGAILNRTAMTINEFTRMYSNSWWKLQSSSPSLSSYEPRTLLCTWRPSLERADQQHIYSRELLLTCAYFHNSDIWFELCRPLIPTELDFHGVMIILCNEGLVELSDSMKSSGQSMCHSIHPCVHSWSRELPVPTSRSNYAHQALICVTHCAEECFRTKNWTSLARLTKHGEFYASLTQEGRVYSDPKDSVSLMAERVSAMGQLAHFLRERGKWGAAKSIYDHALYLCQEAGPTALQLEILQLKHQLGVVLTHLCRFSDAEKMLDAAFRLSKYLYGPDDERSVRVLLDLGSAYDRQYKFAGAQEVYLQARASCLRGSNQHSACYWVATGNLSRLRCESERDLALAQDCYQAYEGLRAIQGRFHRDTLYMGSTLISVFRSLRNWTTEVEIFRQEIYTGFETALGPGHNHTLIMKRNMANDFLIRHMRYQEAEGVLLAVLEAQVNILGADQADTLTTMRNLALLYLERRKYGKCGYYLQQAFDGYVRLLGEHSIDTLIVIFDGANYLRLINKLSEADRAFAVCVAKLRGHFGMEDAMTQRALKRLLEVRTAMRADRSYPKDLDLSDEVMIAVDSIKEQTAGPRQIDQTKMQAKPFSSWFRDILLASPRESFRQRREALVCTS